MRIQAHTTYPYTCSITQTRVCTHTHTRWQQQQQPKHTHNHRSIHAHDTHSVVIFFPIQSLDAHIDSSRAFFFFFLHRHTFTRSLSPSHSLARFTCVNVRVFFRSSILSLFTRSELICEISYVRVTFTSFWVHRFSIFFRTSSSATKNFVSKRTVPKLISKNRK